jgi:hypothetical protein
MIEMNRKGVPDKCTDCKHVRFIRVGGAFDRGEELSCRHPVTEYKVIDVCADQGVLDTPPPEWCPLIEVKDTDAGSVGELSAFQKAVGEWQKATFPKETKESLVAHLRKEVLELEVSHAPEETADCMLLLIGHAHICGYDLLEAAREKFEIVKSVSGKSRTMRVYRSI